MPIRPCIQFGCRDAAEPGRALCKRHLLRPRQCKSPGCPTIVRHPRNIFCDQHEAERRAEEARKSDVARGPANERGYDHRWKAARDSHIARFPLCAECERKGILNGASVVHHKRALLDGGDRLAAANLESLCRECHERIHGRIK